MRQLIICVIGTVFLLATACSHKQKVSDLQPEVVKVVSKENSKDDKSLKCIVGKDERSILLDKEPKRCEVYYTKFGEKSQVAWAEATPSLCTEVFQKIRTNIEEKGYKCEIVGSKNQVVEKAEKPSALPIEKPTEKTSENSAKKVSTREAASTNN